MTEKVFRLRHPLERPRGGDDVINRLRCKCQYIGAVKRQTGDGAIPLTGFVDQLLAAVDAAHTPGGAYQRRHPLRDRPGTAADVEDALAVGQHLEQVGVGGGQGALIEHRLGAPRHLGAFVDFAHMGCSIKVRWFPKGSMAVKQGCPLKSVFIPGRLYL